MLTDPQPAPSRRPFDCEPREVRLLLRLRQLDHEPTPPIVHLDIAAWAITGLFYPRTEQLDPPQPPLPLTPFGARV